MLRKRSIVPRRLARGRKGSFPNIIDDRNRSIALPVANIGGLLTPLREEDWEEGKKWLGGPGRKEVLRPPTSED